MTLYVDEEGRAVSTHSMLKTFRRCPKQAEYKYVERLKSRRVGKPLKRGVWIHKLLEVKYQAMKEGADSKESEAAWREEHRRLSAQFSKLFDEEQDFYGNLPQEILTIMSSYEWHYALHDWKVHEVEFVIEVDLPDGSIYRCKIDLLVEDQYGLWIVDHKSHKTLPKLDYRILDAQSADYVWAAIKSGIPVQGHVWNYIRWRAPGVPAIAYKGKPHQRLSKREVDTDYPTFVRAIRRYAKEDGLTITPELVDHAQHLRSLRYRHGVPQQSTFFRRDVLERSPAMLSRVAREMYHTHRRMHAYPWGKSEQVERVPDRSCTFSCDYAEICSVELWGGDSRLLRRRSFEEADPMSYYHDEKEVAGQDAG